MAKNNATMFDPSIAIAMGLDPKTGLPLKFGEAGALLKGNIKDNLILKDRATALNRFTWYNLPRGLNARLIERILYYKGQGIFFYVKELNEFNFLPFALDGEIDIYGRYKQVRPLPFNGVTEEKEETPRSKKSILITNRRLNVLYDIADLNDYMDSSTTELETALENSCVILRDYSEGISQTITPKSTLIDPILDVMSECFPFMRTALLNSTGVMGMKVSTENEQANVYAASNAVNKAALDGKKYIPIIGGVDFQEMTGGNVGKSEEFLLAMQSLDNFRLGLYGLENGGLFQKKAHILQDEQDMNAGSVSLVMKDSLETRQDFCTICNSIWGTAMWVEATEIGLPEDDMTPGFTEEDVDTNRSDNMSEGGNNE